MYCYAAGWKISKQYSSSHLHCTSMNHIVQIASECRFSHICILVVVSCEHPSGYICTCTAVLSTNECCTYCVQIFTDFGHCAFMYSTFRNMLPLYACTGNAAMSGHCTYTHMRMYSSFNMSIVHVYSQFFNRVQSQTSVPQSVWIPSSGESQGRWTTEIETKIDR